MLKSGFIKKRYNFSLPGHTSASLITLMALGVLAPSAGAQEDPADNVFEEEIVVFGMRSSILSAQDIKRNASNIMESIVAEDIGKLPDRSVTEALARVPGVTVSRFDNPGDPEHFAGEGAGVNIRGLGQVRGELNGRDIFSASNGRGLSFDDVPAELMAGVDVYKSPTADMIEGGLGGIVNLRTRMPFDSEGQTISGTVRANYGDIIGETNFEVSGLYSNRWETDTAGEFGFLIDVSNSELASRADNILTRAYHPRNAGDDGQTAEVEPGRTVYVPRGADWRRNDYERSRNGYYMALQWAAPNENLDVFLTAFRSDAERNWDENAFFLDSGGGFPEFLPLKAADNWVYDANGALISGSITTPQGVPFGTSTRYSANETRTTDISTGIEWRATENLTISADLQSVNSTGGTYDSFIGLVAYPPVVTVANLDVGQSGSPSIYIDPDYLSNYENFGFGQMALGLQDNEAKSTALRLDAEYSFEDAIVTSVKTGVRFSEKSADNREAFNWTARYQPWMFENTSVIPKINNTDFITLFSFEDFQRGDTQVPTTAWLFDQSLLTNLKTPEDFIELTDAIVAVTPGGNSQPSAEELDIVDNINNLNTQEEDSQAAYIMMNFAFESLPTPIYGNVGVRYIKTENVAFGQFEYPELRVTDFDENMNEIRSIQPFFAEDAPFAARNSYNHILPSLNLSLQARDDLIVRMAASQAIWRPEFSRLKALISMNAGYKDEIDQEEITTSDFTLNPDALVDFTVNSGSNPFLEPMEATQADLSVEWYFNEDGGMVYAAIFNKKVEDMFGRAEAQFDSYVAPNGRVFTDVRSETTVNGGTADMRGIEIGGTYFFDTLKEPFDGFGVQANYTYVDSEADIPRENAPLDVDGTDYADDKLPMEGVSEYSYNLVLMYEKYNWNARLAYNWRSEQFLGVGPNGWNGDNNDVRWRLPVFADEYGQLDFSMGYDVSENLSVHFDAYNISQSETRGFILQNGAGKHTSFVYSQDTRYSVSLRAKF